VKRLTAFRFARAFGRARKRIFQKFLLDAVKIGGLKNNYYPDIK